MKKRILGLCTSRMHEDSSLSNLKYIHKYAKENNYNVITFYLGANLLYNQDTQFPEALYMMDMDILDAVIIDATNICDKILVEAIVKKANIESKSVFVIGKKIDNAVSVISNRSATFKEMLEHFIEVHDAKAVNLILSREDSWRSKEYLSIYEEVLCDKADTKNRVRYSKSISDDVHDILADFSKNEKFDAIICESDTAANIAIRWFKDNGVRVPEDVIVAGLDGTSYDDKSIDAITTSIPDLDMLCKKAIELVSDSLEGKEVANINTVNAIPRYALSCGCNYSRDDALKEEIEVLRTIKKENEKIDSLIYLLSENLVEVSQLGEIAKTIEEGMPAGAFLCVKDSFMQDVFQDEISVGSPEKNDKYYVIADTRTMPATWEAFALSDLCPGLRGMLAEEKPIIVAPVYYQKAQYGYFIFNSDKYDIQAFTIEKFLLNFNQIIGRYMIGRKLRFASSELFHANEDIKRLRDRDILTGLYNTRGFLHKLEDLKDESIKAKDGLIVACIDLRKLSDINDVYGHSEGDMAIQTMASILLDCIKKPAICAHIGSDEFVYATHTDCAPENVMAKFFKTLSDKLEQYNEASGKDYSIEIYHAYLVVNPNEKTNMNAFLDEALGRKRLLKQSKKVINDASVLGEDYDANENKIVNDIIDANKFLYAYQPIVSAKDGEIYAYEALMRTDTKEFVSPVMILKYATANDRLYEIEYATFSNVLKQISKEDIGKRKVFINSIPGYLLDDNDYAKIKRLYGKVYENLVVEITEQTELDDKCLNVLRQRSATDGFRIAIDDFGSGYSNTTNLLRFVPNYVKIDRLLISNVHDDPKKQHFVKNIIEFAHDNGFYALAEGVETADEMAAVIHMGVDLIQGFYTAKPSFEILKEIPESICNEIKKDYASRRITSNKKLYIPNNEEDIYITKLALEDYTGVLVSQKDVTLIGNPDYTADFQIKIKDNCECNVCIKDLHLSAIDNKVCIDIGNNSVLSLTIEGNNTFNGNGIRVPLSSKLNLLGQGYLKISTDKENAFGIGNDWHSSFGSVESKMDGILEIDINSSKCIGIGGGTYNGGDGINILKGMLQIKGNGVRCIGIGSVYSEVPITVRECNTQLNISSREGIGIGAWNGRQKVDISSSAVEITANGTTICGIGSVEGVYGEVTVNEAHVVEDIKGSNVVLIGNIAGGFKYNQRKARVDLTASGDDITGIGSYDKSGDIIIDDAMVTFNANGKTVMTYGALDENKHFTSVEEKIKITND